MDYWDNIWKWILSLAELAKSQERSDDSSIVNNYYFVIIRGGTAVAHFSTYICIKEAQSPSGKKMPGTLDCQALPTTESCSRSLLSCVVPIHFGWKKILFILAVLNWASNQHKVTLPGSLYTLSLQVINLYSVVIHPVNPHIVLLASMRCLLQANTFALPSFYP